MSYDTGVGSRLVGGGAEPGVAGCARGRALCKPLSIWEAGQPVNDVVWYYTVAGHRKQVNGGTQVTGTTGIFADFSRDFYLTIIDA